MRRGISLTLQVFLSLLAVALLSVAAAGAVIRYAFQSGFDAYLTGALGTPMGGIGRGMGMGRMVLGVAERTFETSVNRGILLAALAAVALAALAAVLLARYLTGPLGRLRVAARALERGDLQARVAAEGPAEVRELGEAFNDMAGSLAMSEELRRRLVADVAHELRNPVAAVRAQTEGMAEGVLEPSSERLSALVMDLQDLSRLVDDLQELSVAEAGRLLYEWGEADLCALARREAERASEIAAEGVAVSHECAPGAAVVTGDEGRLGQVLRNLLSNAVRHTSAGRIVIRVAAPEGGRVHIEVEDTGEGIAPEDLGLIFERFYRADAARAAGTGGAGIGLAISRRIVEDHGGAVFASSEPGVGSLVGFWVPVSGPPEARA